MNETPTIFTRASVAALLLALGQTTPIASAWAAEQPQPLPPTPQPATGPAAAPAAVTAPAPAPAAAGQPAMSADDIRRQRYQEWRASAAEFGVELPATPPWESAPPIPAPTPDALRRMTPEERRAMRDAYWKQMRADAAERGIAMPENPPWVEARQRREEMAKRYEEYRKTVDAMSEEQREAARAIFGRSAVRGYVPHHPYYGYDDNGGGYWGWDQDCPTWPRGGAYPDRSSDDQGPPPPPATGKAD